jgi:hypothetical protein
MVAQAPLLCRLVLLADIIRQGDCCRRFRARRLKNERTGKITGVFLIFEQKSLNSAQNLQFSPKEQGIIRASGNTGLNS